jgi:hypothetical protein
MRGRPFEDLSFENPEDVAILYKVCRDRMPGTFTPPPNVDGARAFGIYETYGMPLDFMVDAARDAGLGFDIEGFERAKGQEQERARASWKGGSQKSASPVYRELPKTEFEGYSALRVDGARVRASGRCRLALCRRSSDRAG